MQQIVTVGPKSQVVIPKKVREIVRQIKPGRKVVVKPLHRNAVVIEVPEHDWIERTYGLMKGAWKSIDPIKELEKMRNEWDKRH